MSWSCQVKSRRTIKEALNLIAVVVTVVTSWLDNVVCGPFSCFVSVGSVCSESSCPACNCQFSNVQSLAVLVTRIVNDTLFSGLLDDAIQRQFGKSAIHASLGCLMMLLTLLNVSLVKSFFFSFFVCITYVLLVYSHLDTSDFDFHWITEYRLCLHLPLSNSKHHPSQFQRVSPLCLPCLWTRCCWNW